MLSSVPTNWADAVDSDAARRMYAYETPNRAWIKYLLTMVLPRQIRDEVVLSLFEKHIGSSARWAQHWYLDWDDLWAMQAAGHTIGGHGFSHEPLARLSPSEQRRDVGRMASILTEGLGRDIRPFSYPYGSFDAATADACRDAGFLQAFTTCGQPIHRDANVMNLPRIDTIHVEAELQKERACAHA